MPAYRRKSNPICCLAVIAILLAAGELKGGSIESGSRTFAPGPPRQEGYLVIADPAFSSSQGLLNLLALRTSEGYDVTFVDTGTTGTTAQEIMSYIQNAYNTWPIPPAFLVLVGDTDTIPCWIGSGSGTPPHRSLLRLHRRR